MGAALDAGQRGREPGVELDGADRLRLPAVLRAVVAGRPRGADAADEIEPGIEAARQLDRDLAFTNSGGVVDHAWLPARQNPKPISGGLPTAASNVRSDGHYPLAKGLLTV